MAINRNYTRNTLTNNNSNWLSRIGNVFNAKEGNPNANEYNPMASYTPRPGSSSRRRKNMTGGRKRRNTLRKSRKGNKTRRH